MSLSPVKNPNHKGSATPTANHRHINASETDEPSHATNNDAGTTYLNNSSGTHLHSEDQSRQPGQTVIPPGVLVIYHACSNIYKSQPNPLQVTALRKYWLDGPDPLDYISMYDNAGDESRGIPRHWHYVSLGLSDLHGDGRVHERAVTMEEASGYGFELTFRLKREAGETAPPTWPAVLMQGIARYVFQSDNILQGGDHVSWHSPLDKTDSRIRHMLMAEDAQLSPIQTPLGYVNFIQIVGVCADELRAAQHWNGPGVLELLRSISMAGGPWLITDMRRGETIFEVDSTFQDKLDQGIEQEGSNLSGVSGFIQWEELYNSKEQTVETFHSSHSWGDVPRLSPTDTEQIKSTLQKGLRSSHHQPIHCGDMQPLRIPNQKSHRKDSMDSNLSGERPIELVRTRTLEALHLKFNTETGSLLPLALRGRLKHGRHFTFKSTLNDSAVTFVSSTVAGAFVDNDHRFAIHGQWLQILLDDEFVEILAKQLEFLSDFNQEQKPEVMSWPERRLTISIFPDTMIGAAVAR